MMRAVPSRTLAVVLALAAPVPALLAQSPGTITIDAATCMAMAEAAERLACFESQARAAGITGASAAMPATTTASTDKARQEFGLPKAPVEEEQVEELVGNIRALQEIAPNQYLITLADGQVWRQSRPERYSMREGQQVRIYPSRWGRDYRLSVAESRGFVQVTRIK